MKVVKEILSLRNTRFNKLKNWKMENFTMMRKMTLLTTVSKLKMP